MHACDSHCKGRPRLVTCELQGPQKAVETLSRPGSNMTGSALMTEHDAQPDGPAILPAGGSYMPDLA